MAELTTQGVVTKSYAEWLEYLISEHKKIDPEWDVSPGTLDGQKIAIDALIWSSLDQFASAAYQALDIDSTAGQGLDRIGRTVMGDARSNGTKSTVTLRFSGVPGANIGSGFIVKSEVNGSRWVTTSSGSIDSGGTVDIYAQSVDMGAIEAGSGDITILLSVAPGITGVINTSSASTGEARESDASYRYRTKNSVGKAGTNQVDSIRARCFEVTGVKDVLVVENNEFETDKDGVLGKSLAIFVDGGDSSLIASEIASVRSPGCGMNRDNPYIPNKVTLDTTTPNGQYANVTFFRPHLMDLFVSVKVYFYGQEPVGIVDRIKDNIVAYCQGEPNFGSAQGFDRSGFRIGESVHAGRLSTPVNQILGSYGYAECPNIGFYPDTTNKSVYPGFNGLCVFNKENIHIEVGIV